jgi:hypothetical protein
VPDPTPSRGGDDIQAFYLGDDASRELPHSDTAEIGALLLSKEESSRGWTIFACEMLQLVCEILKRQVYVQRRRILFEK